MKLDHTLTDTIRRFPRSPYAFRIEQIRAFLYGPPVLMSMRVDVVYGDGSKATYDLHRTLEDTESAEELTIE